MSEPKERSAGVVKWFNSQKGFGFITVEDCEDEIFVHQSNINTPGFRSLREGEEVEFELVEGEDGKKKAFDVTGPGGTPVQGTPPAQRGGFSGRGGRGGDYGGAYMGPGAAAAYGAYVAPGRGGRGGPAPPAPGYWPTEAAAYYWGAGAPGAAPGMGMGGVAYYPAMPYAAGAAAAAAAARGRGGFFPGGRNWAGLGPSRPPPPGQPGISSGLQVVVHNLPWDCTWQQLKDAFAGCGEIDRADVVFDSRGRSRGFGIVRFASPELAEVAAEKMNNATIGGRVVSVRIDRFA